jgi:hypothetical protein
MPSESDHTAPQPRENPFLTMRFGEFFVIQLITLAFFPASLVICWLVFGAHTTRDLMTALLRDWLQTILILVVLGFSVMGTVLWWVFTWFA